MTKGYLKINRWDLNIILTMIGFPFFTILISNPSASIAYRGFALLVAFMCLRKTGVTIARSMPLKIYLSVLLYISVQAIYGLFFGEYADLPWIAVKMQYLIFNIGIVWVPVLAFVCGFNRIRWKPTLAVFYIFIFITVLHADIRTYEVEASFTGRYDMGRLSTLSFGDNGGYLTLLSVALFETRSFWLKSQNKLISSFLILGMLVGMFGVMKAGSRGPLVGVMCGLIVIIIFMKGKDKVWLTVILSALIFGGALSLERIERFAPALYSRFMMTVEDQDMGGRDVLFANAIEKFRENPLSGSNPIYVSMTQFSGSHNVYLEVLVGSGLIGFILFILALITNIIGFVRYRIQIWHHPGALFLVLLFCFNCGRGLSGIMYSAHPIYGFAFAGVALVLFSYRNNKNIEL